ncbi:DUF3024 domain-containing protein [Vibrio sp.]|uniref:DUF3024 domain-containing protein n=1 Tax=Vibrio sp. TaxID=678 RepID=UPI003D0A1660
MSLISLLQKQVESRAGSVCETRNQSLPVELGKAIYEVRDKGVVFFQQHYLLDSSHCDYTSYVAKVEWDEVEKCWQLSIPDLEHQQENAWLPYPYLPQSNDLTAIMREISKDPKQLFW